MPTIPLIPRAPKVDGIQDEHFCAPLRISPGTPDMIEPDVVFHRKFFNDLDVTMPDGVEVRTWGFYDPAKERLFPNETMRLRVGQVAHTLVETGFYGHTIHHHGIEPTDFNDGVPDTSFIVLPRYTYQWKPRMPGTYFYHCHVIATLHVEAGMYGFLIVDPPNGPGWVQRANEQIPYQAEGLWAFDDIDPRFHEMNHSEGRACPFLIRADAAMHHFDPKYFLISGVPAPLTEKDPRVVVTAELGATVLLRALSAAYVITDFSIPDFDAEIIGIDGRAQGQAPFSQYSAPIPVENGTPIRLTTAQRRDLLLKADKKGTFPVEVTYRHHITRDVLATARTFINVV